MSKKLNKVGMVYAAIMAAVLLTGCGAKGEEEPIIMVDASEEDIVYSMGEVSKGDVILTKKISCKYTQTSEQSVAFPMGGKIVDKVYVKVGDQVEVGDLLVALEGGNIVDDIASLEYQIARNELNLSYLDKAEEFDRQNAYYNLVYNTQKTEDDLKNYNDNIADIEERYTYQREDYSDNIEFDKRKLEKLKSEYEGNRVYATMAGKVLYIKPSLEGSTAKKDDVIMTIVDNGSGLFEIEEPDAKKYFTEGKTVAMNVSIGDAKGDYELMPHNINEWDDIQRFEVVVAPDTATLEVGVSGTIIATVDKKDNVLRIPLKALYNADDKYYTYVLNSENLREAKFIEVGLIGDDYAEIISGIEEGMKVVKR